MIPQTAEALRDDATGATEHDDQALASDRIAAAASLPFATPEIKAFFDAFYRAAPPDDILRYPAQSLVDLAALVYAHSSTRMPGETLVSLFDFHARTQGGGTRAETIFLAVNDDMPFLFDSLMGELAALGARVHGLFHPIIPVTRDAVGARAAEGTRLRESVIVLVLDPILDEHRLARVAQGARYLFGQVKLAVRDWRAMKSRLKDAIASLEQHPPGIPAEELYESIQFLEWLEDDHFTFLGCRDYAFHENEARHEPIDESGLGLLSDPQHRVIRRGADRARLTPEVKAFLNEPHPLIIAKASERTVVHRRAYMDYVGVKMFDSTGRLTGERRFVGLFTTSAYSRRASEIPLLRLKLATIRQRAGFPRDSHDGKALAQILDSLPREDLFQASVDELFAVSLSILRLTERPKVRVFARFDRFDRFVSVLVFVPRDRYDSQARERIHAILARAFDGRRTTSTPAFDESMLVRVHYIVGRNEGPRPHVDIHALEAEIRDAIRTWDDGFVEALTQKYGARIGLRRFRDYAPAFLPRYRDVFSPGEALCDLEEFEDLQATHYPVRARAYRVPGDAHAALHLKLYVLGKVLPLSVSLPVFENLGFRVIAEDSYPVALESGDGANAFAAVLDFQMERADGRAAALEEIRARLEEAFHAIVSGQAENDGFNRLIVGANLAWREVTILRAAAKFLRQASFPFSQEYIEQALFRNPDIAALLVALFKMRNDPDGKDREAGIKSLQGRIDAALNDVPSLDDDRIVRRLRNTIDCVLRTNYFQRDANGAEPSALAIKLDSQNLEELPAPRPHVEIFVYSPKIEGVHLRFGKVARGGIRWSDRKEDFRTEILGLVKAQQVKNAVIVPVGAKGGFYPKQLPVNGTREDVQAAAIEAYKILIGALLDLTDNIHPDGRVVPPERVVRYDEDDPYLVVAADKGTASFSDIANGLAEERGFWLGDAFASGGSHGYDHKKMGITAKGAWEAVKRHFRELGRDIQNEAFSCVGVGDMSGDVFGNGMLLSRKTKLVAAFDHRHIFLDPDPDPEASWTERQRMFDLPRSSWADYDRALISAGGGVYPRSAKTIVLSPQVKALTGLAVDKASPNELIKALLKAEIDLLWFGGIGTFVKSSAQTNADAGDRANDAVRVDGREVRARVVGEGANLGLTQLGRVEYALAGGRLNTDAIDNSAGVDTSDHEVNLKILLSGPLRLGTLSPDARDALLNEMTDDVAAHVLRDNYDQTLALSVAVSRAAQDLDSHGRFIRDLEKRGRLDRAVEFLPDDEALRKRAQDGLGLTRPELAVLLAYAKLDLDQQIVASDLPDQAWFASALAGYFPAAAVTRFPDELIHHRLRREIVATVLSNRIVNLAGPVFVHRIKEIASAPAARVARAFVLAEGAFDLSALKLRIDALDGRVKAQVQSDMYAAIAELLRRLGLWFLINVPGSADLGDTIARHRAGVDALRGTFSELVSPWEAQDTETHIATLQKEGVPLDLAEDVAVLSLIGGVPEIVALAQARGMPVDMVAGTYFAVGASVGLDRLRGLAQHISGSEYWDRLAIRRIVDDLYAGQRALAGEALAALDPAKAKAGTRKDGADAVTLWAQSRADALDRTKTFLDELERTGDLSIAKLTLANSQIHELAAR